VLAPLQEEVDPPVPLPRRAHAGPRAGHPINELEGGALIALGEDRVAAELFDRHHRPTLSAGSHPVGAHLRAGGAGRRGGLGRGGEREEAQQEADEGGPHL
jgi:hypothetical protein